MKLRLIVFAVAVLVMQMFSSAFAQVTEVQLDLGDRVAHPGEEFVMFFYIESEMPAATDPNKVTSADIKVSWDQAMLEYKGVEFGRAVPAGWTMTSVVGGVNNLEVVMSGTEPITMQAGILKYTFKVLGSAPNTTWVISEKVLFNSGNPATSATDGKVTIEEAQTYTLTVNVEPPEGGTVTKNPDKANYNDGEQVTLTATPSDGYSFVEWTGDATGTNTQVTVTMNSNKTVTARFEFIPLTLTVNINPTGGGTVTKNPNKSGYNKDEVVTLTAVPSTDYAFNEWTGDVTGTNPVVNVTMNSNKTVTANFIRIAGIKNVELDLGDRTAEPGEEFVMFYYITSEMPAVGDPNEVKSADIKVSWDQTKLQYVNVEFGRAVPAGWTMTSVVTTANTVEVKMSGSTAITEQAGILKYTFKVITSSYGITWVNGDKAIFNSGDPATTTNNGKVSIEDKAPYPLTIIINPPEGGTVTKNPDKAEYNQDEVVTLTATANADYTFVEWTGDATGTNSVVSITMNTTKTVTANFEIISPPKRPEGLTKLYLMQETYYVTGGSTSNLGHPVSDYDFNWGNGDNSGFNVPSRSYKWDKTGTFLVKARSRCDLHPNVISKWSDTLGVTIVSCKVNTTISPTGAGSVTINPDTSAYYYDQSVTLTAIPADQRFVFDHWSGYVSGKQNPVTMVMKGEHNVTAHFNVIGEFVSVPATLLGPNAGFTKQNLNFSTSGSTNNFGHEVEYQFDWGDGSMSSWGGGSDCHAYSKSGSYNVKSHARCKIHTDVVSAWSVTHVVKISMCSLFVKINPSDSAGIVTKNPNKFEFDYGDSVRLSPVPASGYSFDHWSGDLSGTANPALVIMDSTKNVSAHFVKIYKPDSLTIVLDKGWNMISINIVLLDPNIEKVFSPVIQNLKIVEDYSGRMFVPAQGLNTIGKMNYKEGYKVFMAKADTLIITGDFVDPTTPIIVPTKWSMISYLPKVILSVEQALISIKNPATILKSNEGLTWIPAYGINNIDKMQPGKGYQIYLDKIDTLSYPPGFNFLANVINPGDKDLALTAGITLPEHFKFNSKTGENAIIVVTTDAKPNYSDGTKLEAGDEIGVFTAAGLCCGAIVWENMNAAITVWGDDSQTESIDGFRAGDAFNFRVYRKKTASEHPAAVKYQETHLAIYQANGFSALTELQGNVPPSAVSGETGISAPKHFNLFQNYPNPFNPDTRIDYEIPVASQVTIKIFNILGQHVRTLVNEFKLAGNHSITWDRTDNLGNEVPSGIYMYVMSARDFEMMKRMIIMK